MSMHSIRKCPVCHKDSGLFVDSKGNRAVWQCINKHRFANNAGNFGVRITNAPSTRIQFRR